MNYVELLREILENGKKNRDTLELMHVPLLVNEDCIYDFPEVRPLSQTSQYMMAEIPWFMSGDRDQKEISKYAKLWSKIKNVDGTVNSNYGHLVFYNVVVHPSLGSVALPPFEWAAKCLEEDWNSRQGVVTYNTGAYNYPGNLDYICSQHQAFYIRNESLLCFVALRSSDSIWGLPYNMVWWQLIYQQMYIRLKKKYPWLRKSGIKVTIYSSHIYEKHFELVRKMLNTFEKVHTFKLEEEIPLGHNHEWYKEHLKFEFKNEVCLLGLI